MSSKLSVPTFLNKLIKILEDNECKDCISWIQTEDGFQICKIHEFTDKILPKYFKHQNYSSFVRQLNMYGFTKLKSTQSHHVYHNPYFKKGVRSSLKKITRKIHSFQQQPQLNKKRSMPSQRNENNSLKSIQQIKQRQFLLQQRFRKAFEDNKKVFVENIKINTRMNGDADKQENSKQVFIDSIFKMIQEHKKSSNKLLGQSAEIESLLYSSSSMQDKRSRFQKGSIQASTAGYKIQQFLQLNQFEQIQQFQDLSNFGNEQNISDI